MRTYMRCIRHNKTCYSQHDGMRFEVLRSLLADLGGSDIQQVTEVEYLEHTSR